VSDVDAFADLLEANEEEKPRKSTKQKPEEVKMVPVVVSAISLKPAYTDLIVYSVDQVKAWIVSKQDYPADITEIPEDVLNRAPVAYGFEDEIAGLLPALRGVQLAFYRLGIVSKTDLADKARVRSALNLAFPDAFDFQA